MSHAKRWFSLFFLILSAFTVVSCGGSSSTDPTPNANVAGRWSFSGRQTSDTCQFDFLSLSATEVVNVEQNGTILTGQHLSGNLLSGNWLFTGSVNGNTFALAASNPLVYVSSGCDFNLGTGMNVTNIQGTASPGTMNITAQGVRGCFDSCQAMYTGTWTKI